MGRLDLQFEKATSAPCSLKPEATDLGAATADHERSVVQLESIDKVLLE
jgi:hypothetical protein